MSFDKAIEYKKEKRKIYRKSKAFDSSCRNHGSCDYCKDNRTYSVRKAKESSEDKLNEDYCEDENYDKYIEEQKELDNLNEIYLNSIEE